MDVYDPLYLQGIAEFNRENYFQSHEIWEALWTRQRGPSRQFYKGLIQAAVALHHLGRGNLQGASTLSARSRECLRPYRPKYLGLDVDAFLAEMDRHVGGVSTCGPSDGVSTGRGEAPQIRLDSRPDPPAL